MRWLALLLAILMALLLAVPAEAVLSGRNGRIAFTSGRESVGDDTAQIFTINPINPQFGVTGPLSIPAQQNRHASWSPDRTKLVFASGTPGTLATEQYDLYVKDFAADTITALDATEALDALSSDHPAWSPDGTRVAYEAQPVDNSTERDIKVKFVNASADGVNLTPNNMAPFQLKPAWSPDSTEIYFAQSPTPPPGATQFDIVKKPANAAAGDASTSVLAVNTVDEYQPSISPDGTKICYTRQTTLGDSGTADVLISDLPGGGNTKDISDNVGAAAGDINCTFSPDGLKVAFTQGTFSTGKLMIENVNENDAIPPLAPLTDDSGSNNFDGNADWAPDAPPTCPDSTITTARNTPITFTLTCTDTGPANEQSDVKEFPDTSPTNGALDQDLAGGPLTYTPNPGFSGTDTFDFRSFDDFGFGGNTATVTINVRAPAVAGGGAGGGAKPKCGGKTATIVGTAGKNTLVGTTGRDVIVGLGANDTIRGGRGNDIICGGSGRDKIGGGSGNDRVSGGSGNDRVSGDSGKDSLKGDSGNDRVKGGSGRDKLNGGSGRDRLNGGSGRDGCKGGAGRDRGSRCERSSSIIP